MRVSRVGFVVYERNTGLPEVPKEAVRHGHPGDLTAGKNQLKIENVLTLPATDWKVLAAA